MMNRTKCNGLILKVAGVFFLLASADLLAQFAVEVIDHSPASFPGGEQNILGTAACEGNDVDFDNVGSMPGFVTVGFDGVIFDGPGDDIFLVLRGFQPNQQTVEDFTLFASDDGTDFLSLGYRNPNDFDFAVDEEVRFGFDLGSQGLSTARFIKVENGQVFVNTSSEGPDICGFEAVHLTAAIYSCIGFQAPMNEGPVTVRKNRVLPLKAELFDPWGSPVTNFDVIAPPVLQVSVVAAGDGDAVDVTDQALPVGRGTEGNQFLFSDGSWRYNLKTKNYTATGTYTITMVSGDDSEYLISSCVAEFVVE